jgi:uncharacterized protein (UPF0335 family)
LLVNKVILNGTHQLLAYTDDVNRVEENIDTTQKSKEALLHDSKKVGLGRAMAQVVSRRPLTAKARVRARVNPCGICGGQNGSGAGFSPSSSIFSKLILWGMSNTLT